MKKLLCLLTSLLLLVPVVQVASAEEQASSAEDLQSYIATLPSDFIAELIGMLNMELAKRGEVTATAAGFTTIDKEVIVPMGEYTVGIDIPAGVYTFKCEVEQARFYIESPDGEDYSWGTMHNGDVYANVQLDIGYSVVITYGPLTFAPYTGLGF